MPVLAICLAGYRRAAVRVLPAFARTAPNLSGQEKIRIDIVMRNNLP